MSTPGSVQHSAIYSKNPPLRRTEPTLLIYDTTLAKQSSCTSKIQWKITESMVKIPVGPVSGPLYRVLQVLVSICGPQSDTRTHDKYFQNEYLSQQVLVSLKFSQLFTLHEIYSFL